MILETEVYVFDKPLTQIMNFGELKKRQVGKEAQQ